jgi:hypothetical protein
LPQFLENAQSLDDIVGLVERNRVGHAKPAKILALGNEKRNEQRANK